MSFCFLLNAVLLFCGVLGFVIAGFAGTFSRNLYPYRYRLMLGPLGFVILGSTVHSVSSRLLHLYSHIHPAFSVTHPSGFGSGAEIFETIMLVTAGLAGVMCGVMLGDRLDQPGSGESTYTIANYWTSRKTSIAIPSTPPKENVVPITCGKKEPGVVPHIRAISETAISEPE